jgi:hypothetical protein
MTCLVIGAGAKRPSFFRTRSGVIFDPKIGGIPRHANQPIALNARIVLSDDRRIVSIAADEADMVSHLTRDVELDALAARRADINAEVGI